MNDLIIYISEKILYINIYSEIIKEEIYGFDNLYEKVCELNASKKDNMYVFIDISFLRLNKNKIDFDLKVKEVLKKIKKIYKVVFVGTYFDILEFDKLVYINYDNIYYVEKNKNRLLKFEKKTKDFLDDIKNIEVLSLNYEEIFENICNSNLNELRLIYFKYYILDILKIYFLEILFFLSLFIIYIFFNIVFSTRELLNENEYLNSKLENLKFELEDDTKVDKIETKKEVSILKKNFYLDIEKLIDSSKYGINYEKIDYENDIWIISGNAQTFKILSSYEEKLSKDYKVSLKEIKDLDSYVHFVLKLENKV